MAVNALGQTIQLLLNQSPKSDLSLGLKAGDLLQGRLIELLPDNRAVLQIKGQNLVAQLPQAHSGQQFNKGMQLDLAVLQAQPDTSLAPPAPQSKLPVPAPALTLKLLGLSTQTSTPGFFSQIGSPENSQPIPQPTLEALLTQAKLPITPATLQAAASLSRYGLPLNSQTLHSVIQTAERLVQVENPVLPALQDSSPLQTKVLPAQALQSLNDAKTLLNIVASQPARAAERPQIQAIIHQIEAMVSTKNPISLPQLTPRFNSLPEITAGIDKALNQVSDAKPRALQNFVQLLSDIKSSIPLLASSETVKPVSTSATAAPTPAAPPVLTNAGAAPTPPPADLPMVVDGPLKIIFKREVSAAVIRSMAPLISDTKATQAELIGMLNRISMELQQPGSTLAERIFDSSLSQLPTGKSLPVETLPILQQAVAEIQQSFASNPLPRPLRSTAGLVAELEIRNIPAPKTSLSDLPREVVVEAVAFLKARDIPVSRPAVEAVASQLHQGTNFGQQLNLILSAESELPPGLLEMQPPLAREFQSLRNFLNLNGIHPEGSEPASQIRDFMFKSGLNLETELLKLSSPDKTVADSAAQTKIMAPEINPADTLKAGLLRLKDSVQEATRHPAAQASPELALKLEELGSRIDSTLNAMHTLQLAAKPTPAFDVTTVQLPVFFGGQMQSGQLSIYWKKGRPHEINAQDPVNVVFLLNTRGLGDVKVQLQVWKNECRCKVSVSDDDARKFIEAEAPDLEKSFSDNTPFRLSSLDISAAMEPLKRVLDFVEDVALRRLPGLNLTA